MARQGRENEAQRIALLESKGLSLRHLAGRVFIAFVLVSYGREQRQTVSGCLQTNVFGERYLTLVALSAKTKAVVFRLISMRSSFELLRPEAPVR